MATGRARVDWVGYAARWKALHGGYDPSTAALPVRAWLRASYRMACGLSRLRLRPAQVTVLGLLVCLAVPVVAALRGSWPVLAGLLVVLGGLLDTLDGALAVVTRTVTRYGYVYDSLADRLGEAAWLVAFWLIGVPGWVVALTACLVFLHEYLRARATAAGLAGLGSLTVAERPIRALISACGLALVGVTTRVSETLAVGAGTLAVAIWLLFGLVGFLQLFAAVQRGLR